MSLPNDPAGLPAVEKKITPARTTKAPLPGASVTSPRSALPLPQPEAEQPVVTPQNTQQEDQPVSTEPTPATDSLGQLLDHLPVAEDTQDASLTNQQRVQTQSKPTTTKLAPSSPLQAAILPLARELVVATQRLSKSVAGEVRL